MFYLLAIIAAKKSQPRNYRGGSGRLEYRAGEAGRRSRLEKLGEMWAVVVGRSIGRE